MSAPSPSPEREPESAEGAREPAPDPARPGAGPPEEPSAECVADDASAIAAAFLTRLLDDQDHGRAPSLAEYQRLYPGFEDLIAEEHARALTSAGEPLPAGAPDHAAAAGEGAAPVTRYRVESELGRGGMGHIFSVWDPELRRRVAMKILRARGAMPGAAGLRLDRFIEEAQVTAQLDHPGIVPVHELGVDEAGRRFFTMSLVRGRDLAQIFESVRTGADGWTLTRALGVVLKVCEAVAFAHSKGVIHRDLKPANIMVGRFGETYVMDWGLARVQGGDETKDIRIAAEAGDAGITSSRREAADSSHDSALVTMDGDILGTPAYMAPEQARGEVERLGPRSDVYSLGAMLYHLLGGRMPYAPAGGVPSARAVLAAVVAGPPVAIARLAPSTPPELVSICAKAMARDPDDRYGAVLELAEDLQAFLENRVVAAHRRGALVELRKWVQRNRLAAAACALALLAVLVGASVSWVFKLRADAGAVRAEAGYSAALDAVDRMLTGVAEGSLVEVPGAERVRRELLQEAQRLYMAFLTEHGDRRELRVRAARANDALAVIHDTLGELDAAEQRTRAAIAAHEEMLAGNPGDADVAFRMVNARTRLAMLAAKRGRAEEGEAAYLELLRVIAPFLARHPEHLGLHGVEAKTENDLAIVTWQRGARDEAIARARRATELYDALATRSGGRTKQLLAVANSGNTLGGMLVQHSAVDEAEQALGRATVACEQVLAREPRNVDARARLGNVLMTFDYVHTARGQVEARKQAVERALEIYLDLMAEFPRVPDYHSAAAAVLNNRALILQDEEQLEEALVDLEQALRHERIALAAVPDHGLYLERMRNHLINEMWTLKLLGRHREIAERADQLLETDRGGTKPDAWRDAGAFLLMAAALAAKDRKLAEDERARRREQLVDLGCERIRTAIQKGLRDANRFRSSDLGFIREHPKVREVLSALEK